jgi:uncharacterized protein YgiM (DUF1202 family)
MSRFIGPYGRPFIAAYAAFLFFAATPLDVAAESKPAVVEGTSQLFIRRGPGTEFPPFATLTGGSQVQVEETHGSWARVTTASGQVGYVHTRFLTMIKAEAAQSPTIAPPAVQPTRRSSPPTSKERAATKTSTPAEIDEKTPDVVEPTATPVELTADTRPRSAAGAAASLPEERTEIRRLADAVEALNRRFDQRLPVPNGGASSTVIEPTAGVSGGAVLLGLLGVVVGWLLGATYQRNKERGRRSRIRL